MRDILAETTARVEIDTMAADVECTARQASTIRRMTDTINRLRVLLGLEREESFRLRASNRCLQKQCEQYQAILDDLLQRITEGSFEKE